MPDGPNTNVDSLPTQFFDRTDELAELRQLVEGGARLVTIVGAAGAGKTRLAREFAHRNSEMFSDGGSWFCRLAGADHRDDIVSAVAKVLETSLEDADSFEKRRDHVGRALEARGSTLVVLDNFEQITETSQATVGRWLEQTEETCFLVTSRERLRLHHEHCFDLESLPPDYAVALFEDRARKVRNNFVVDDNNYAVIEKLVSHLDGIPLAIELAAARTRTMSPSRMLDRISSRFQFLRSPNRDSEPRQATLREAIAWSWDKLEPWEREALTQCTVFRGGFSLDAAEGVLDVSDKEAPWLVDTVETLVDKSLLTSRVPSDFPADTRFDMYESIREYVGRETEADESVIRPAERRHAEYFARQATEWTDRLGHPDGEDYRIRLRLELDNLFAAFARFRERDPSLAFELAVILDEGLRNSGAVDRRRRVIDFLVEIASSTDSPRRAAVANESYGEWLAEREDLEEAVERLESAYESARGIDDDRQTARILARIGEIERKRGRLDRAVERLERALGIASSGVRDGLERGILAHLASCRVDLGELDAARDCVDRAEGATPSSDLRQECESLMRLAYVHYYLDNLDRQRSLHERALEYARQLESPGLEGRCLQGLGDAAFSNGDYSDAVELYEEALDVHRSMGNRHYEGILLGNLGAALHRNERLEDAGSRYGEALRIHRDTGAEPYRGIVLHALGVLAHERDDYEQAVRFYARAADTWAEIGSDSDRAAATLCRAWLEIERGELEAATEYLQSCLEGFDAEREPGWLATTHATFGLAHALAGDTESASRESSRAEEAWEDRENTETMIAKRLVDATRGHRSPRSDEDDRGGPLRYSLYGRVVLHLIAKLDDPESDIEAPNSSDRASRGKRDDRTRFLVGPGSRWFVLSDGDPVDLRRRGSIRRVIDALVEQLEADSGEALDVYELFDAGWPDEEIAPDQAANRVYWAIRTVRDLGLEDYLLTSDDGYYLDSSQLTIERSDRQNPPESA